MLEAMVARAAYLGGERARARRRDLADRLTAGLPHGMTAETTREGVLLSGHRARSRFALDPELRGLIAGLLK
jgi:hypothetical protein